MPHPMDGDEGGRMEIEIYLPMQSISPALWAGLLTSILRDGNNMRDQEKENIETEEIGISGQAINSSTSLWRGWKGSKIFDLRFTSYNFLKWR